MRNDLTSCDGRLRCTLNRDSRLTHPHMPGVHEYEQQLCIISMFNRFATIWNLWIRTVGTCKLHWLLCCKGQALHCVYHAIDPKLCCERQTQTCHTSSAQRHTDLARGAGGRPLRFQKGDQTLILGQRGGHLRMWELSPPKPKPGWLSSTETCWIAGARRSWDRTSAGVNTHHSVRIRLIYCGRWHWEDSRQRDVYTSENGNPHVDADSRPNQGKGRFRVLLWTLGFEKKITRFKA